jgi:hypothetical protein
MILTGSLVKIGTLRNEDRRGRSILPSWRFCLIQTERWSRRTKQFAPTGGWFGATYWVTKHAIPRTTITRAAPKFSDLPTQRRRSSSISIVRLGNFSAAVLEMGGR